MNKIKEIIGAWMTSFNPTEEQKELAEKRYEICLGCEYYGESRPIIGDEYCKECLCPLQRKIFTQKLNDSCRIGKWEEVERQYREDKLKKNKYKII